MKEAIIVTTIAAMAVSSLPLMLVSPGWGGLLLILASTLAVLKKPAGGGK
jgi:hypothetical protein